MTQGYLLYAQGEQHKKYAQNLAQSLRSVGDTRPISLVTDKKHIDDVKIFDFVIEVEENTDKFHVVNRSKLIEWSPYEETTVIESDCLVTQSLENWWTRNKNKELAFISQAYTYRQQPLDATYDRKTWVQNDLPNLYVACHYYKKTKFTKQFFDLVLDINMNLDSYKIFVPNRNPKIPSMDIAICLATKILDCYEDVAYTSSDPMFVHMKPYSQGLEVPSSEWSDKLGFYRSEKELYIGTYRQKGIIHYIEDVV